MNNEFLYHKYSLSVLTDVIHSRLLSFYCLHVRTVQTVLFIIYTNQCVTNILTMNHYRKYLQFKNSLLIRMLCIGCSK